MTKERKQKIKKWSMRIGVGFIAFAAGLATTFLLVPGRVRNIVFDEPEIEVVEETHFSKFVTRMMNAIDVDSSETMEGVVGSIDELTVEWPQNKIVVDGDLALSMRNLNDFDVTVDLGINYNEKEVELGIGYTGKTFYLALQDLFIKSSYISTQDLMDKVYNLFFNPGVSEDEGLGMSIDFDGVIDSLIGDLDLGSLMSGGGAGGLGLETGEEEDLGNGRVKTPLKISLGEDLEPIELSLILDKNTNDLLGANIGNLAIGDVKISGGLSFEIFKDHQVYGFDSENYIGRRDYKSKNFIEVINYKTWFDDIFNLLNKKAVGIDLNFSADQDDGTGPVNIGQIEGKIDVDASKFNLWDYIPKVINAETFSKDEVVTKDVVRSETGEENVVETILDNLNAGIDLSVGKGDEHYADLNLTYADNSAYLSLNDDVIKAKMDVESLNLLISKISTLVEGEEEDQVRKMLRNEEIPTGETTSDGLFDFITGSDLVKAIKEGHYEGIIDVLESISNSNDGINLKLNLSSLGLGENSKVELNLDATDNGEKGVTSIKCTDICMDEGIFNLELNTRDYEEETIGKVLADKDNYRPLDFVIGVFDQVSGILDSKQAGFSLEGSLKGSDGLGMSFDGRGQLDYGEKYGFGDINIYNHKNVNNPAEKTETHPVSLYVDNTTNDKQINNMKLCYGPTGKLKGKLSVQSLEDIVGVVKKIIDANDRRFAKFLDPLMKIIRDSVIGKIIASKDYMQLSKETFVKSIYNNLDDSCLDIDLSKDLFAGFVVEDMKIRLNFETKNDSKQLKSLQIIDLKLNETLGNKIVNCTITVEDFDKEKEVPIDLNATYMNFSSLATLLEFAIDTTELNTYHLTADVRVKLGSVLDLVTVKLDFYIEVLGENTRVYGRFIDIPYVLIASNDANADVNTEFLFEPAKHYSATSDDTIGGYFHILRTEDHKGWFDRNFEQYYYRSTSKGFLDNILDYLLGGCLDFKYSIIDTLGGLNLNSSSTPVYENMFNENGFVDVSDASSYGWALDLNLGALTGITAFNTLQATIKGSKVGEKSYLNSLEGYLPIRTLGTDLIQIRANIALVNPVKDPNGWADRCSIVSDRYEKICGIYNSVEDKETWDATYLDKSQKSCTVKLDAKADYNAMLKTLNNAMTN